MTWTDSWIETADGDRHFLRVAPREGRWIIVADAWPFVPDFATKGEADAGAHRLVVERGWKVRRSPRNE